MEQDMKHGDGTSLPLQTKGQVSAITRMEQSRTFMEEDILSMEVQTSTPINFKIGDIIYVHGDPYCLNKLPTVKKDATRRYTYTLELEGGQYGLIQSQFLLFDNITDAMVAAPSQYTLTGLMLNSLTGNASDILKMIVLNANRVNGDGKWVVGTYPSGTETLNFTLEDGTCLEALQKLCEDWWLEFEIIADSTTGVRTINLKAEPQTITPKYTFNYGKTGGLYSIERTSKGDDVITRLYAYGGTQNIPSSYLSESNTNRLCIRQQNGTRPRHLSYVENTSLQTEFGVRESVQQFDEIYPKRTGTVTNIYTTGTSPELKFRDSSMFDLNARDEETDETLYLIPGTTAKVVFQTGQLAGYTFEITDYNTTQHRFTIKAIQEEGDLVLPSPDISQFRIKVGDTYILTDINLPNSYVTAAEDTIKTEATKKLAEINNDMFTYTVEVDSRYVKNHATDWGRTEDHPFVAGDFVRITDSTLNIDTTLRLTQYTHDLIADTYQLTIERYVVRTKTKNSNRRRWYIDREISRIADVYDRDLNNEVTRTTEMTIATADEVVAARGSSANLNTRISAVNTAASNAATVANNALTKANTALYRDSLLRRYVNNGNFADRHISDEIKFADNKFDINANTTIKDSLAALLLDYNINEWTNSTAVSIDFKSGEYDANEAYAIYAALKDDGEAAFQVALSKDEVSEACLLIGEVSAEDGNGDRTFSPAIAQAYIDAGILRDSSGNAVLDINSKTLYGATKIVGLRNAANTDNIDLVSLLGALPSTAGGLRKQLADNTTIIGADANSGLRKRMSDAETTIGDANSGLVKDVADLDTNKADSSDVPTIAEVNTRFSSMNDIRDMIATIYNEMLDWNSRIATWTNSMQSAYPNTPSFPQSKTTCAHKQLDEQVCRTIPIISEITRS